jgi:hypothetical protein
MKHKKHTSSLTYLIKFTAFKKLSLKNINNSIDEHIYL